MQTTQNLLDEAPLIVWRMLERGLCSKPRNTGDREWRRHHSARRLEAYYKKKGNR